MNDRYQEIIDLLHSKHHSNMPEEWISGYGMDLGKFAELILELIEILHYEIEHSKSSKIKDISDDEVYL